MAKACKLLFGGILAARIMFGSPSYAQKLPVEIYPKISQSQYETELKVEKELDKIAGLLNAYKSKAKRFPKSLEEIGKFKDPLGPSLYQYVSDGDDFILYSSGLDWQDDSGVINKIYLIKEIENHPEIKNRQFFNEIVRFSTKEGYQKLVKRFKDEKDKHESECRQRDAQQEMNLKRELMKTDIEAYEATQNQLKNLAILLDEYKKEKKQYPSKLEQLIPILEKMGVRSKGAFIDYLSHKMENLRYVSDGQDFIVYSIGRDQVDDKASLKTKAIEIGGKSYIYGGDVVKFSSEKGYGKLRQSLLKSNRR